MQIKNFFVFSLLGGAIAQSAISKGFDAIGVALDSLDSAVVALTDGGNVQAATADLSAKSAAIVKAIADATTTISASKELTLSEATGVLTPAKNLLTKTRKTVDDLISKKPIIVKAGQTATVKSQLEAQAKGAKGLADAVVSRMPSATKTIAQSQADAIGKEIARGIAAFT